ncbi:MAG: ribonuclease Y [Caulobacteraceae bacterium]|nr:ribonuclease Y [Caulobacteraceae bacterium]
MSYLIAAVAVLAAGGLLLYFFYLLPQRQALLRTAEEQKAEHERFAKEIETRRKELLLEAREEAHRLRDEVAQEDKEKRAELQRLERKLAQKEDSLEEKGAALDRQWDAVRAREREIQRAHQEAAELRQRQEETLQGVAGMTAAEARAALFKDIEDQTRHEAARLVQRIEEEAKAEGDRRARSIISVAIQRLAADHVSETTVSVVPLPSDDVKGRIIGREGRNIRAFETLTGVDVIIDDTPEAVVLSAFDPVRREIARLALTALIADGRIHPGRIEETVAKAQQDVDKRMQEAGERAVMETGVTGLHPELVKLLGRMHYRTSYGQNLLDHSIEVCLIGTSIAAELGANVMVAKRGCLLHDLGKVVPETDMPHALLSQELMLRYGESAAAAHAAGAHHEEIPLETVEDVIVQLADAVSAARPGARRETLETYVKRLRALETIGDAFPGVEKAYAVQAGREIRLMVRPEVVDDAAAHALARDAAKRIEEEMDYPGQIKVTVIRETRAINYAK